MTKRTRVFVLTAVGVLVVGLGTVGVASYVGLQSLTILGGGQASELAYIPEDVHAVAFANVREVMDSELRTKFLDIPDRTPDDQDAPLNKFYEATGLDVETDVDRVVATLSTGQGGSKQYPLLVVRGRFDTARIESFARQEANARVEDYSGTRVLAFDENGDRLAVAFAEPGLLVLGTSAAVRRSLDIKASGVNVTRNAEVMNLVRESDDGNAWAVARFDALTGNANLPQEITDRLPAITWFSVSGHVNGGLHAVLRAETKDEKAADNLRDVLRGFIALARLQSGQRPEFEALMDSFELGGTGKTVSFGFAIDPAVIEALGALRGLHQPGVVPPAVFEAFPSLPAPPAL